MSYSDLYVTYLFCDPNPLQCSGPGSCGGSQLFGLVIEVDYPYMSGTIADTGYCRYDLNTLVPVAGITGYTMVSSNYQDDMMHVVANIGPVAVGVDASGWKEYTGGVFDGCGFDDNIDLNHAVAVVGYGTDPEEGDYWLVRNSWGESWGEEGPSWRATSD